MLSQGDESNERARLGDGYEAVIAQGIVIFIYPPLTSQHGSQLHIQDQAGVRQITLKRSTARHLLVIIEPGITTSSGPC